jgi:hypothetical protein
MDDKKAPVETTDFLKMVSRMIRVASVRVGNADELQLAQFAVMQKDMEKALGFAIRCQLDQGKSWADIGKALEISRQAAFKRFSL